MKVAGTVVPSADLREECQAGLAGPFCVLQCNRGRRTRWERP